MIYFRSDYSQGAHPKVMEALMKTNLTPELIGVQFEALLDGGMDSIYFSMAEHANRLAAQLREVVRKLEKDFFFYEWETRFWKRCAH